MSDYEVTLTGTLSNLATRTDQSLIATLTHPEVQVQAVFPAEVRERHADLIQSGARVTVFGEYAGATIRAAAVSEAVR